MDVHIGRQPVFDRAGDVIGHELLFRDADVAHARFSSGSAATARVLLASLLDFGLTDLVGDGLAFVNLPRPYLVGQLPIPCPPGRVVLEVLEDVGHDDELLTGVRALRAAGHLLALDDFIWTEESACLLPHVDIVKIDVLQHGPGVEAIVRRCQAAGASVLAEKVETVEQLRLCRELGVSHYQGYLLERPQVLQGRSLSPGQATCLQLVGALERENVSAAEVGRLVRSDAALSYRLLRAANAAAVGARRTVTSLDEALLLLGFEQLRRWALLLVVADLPGEAGAGVEATLLRAAMCERLATSVDGADSSAAFVVGLVSGLDALLRQPLPDLLAHLPLSAASRAALLDRAGPLGAVLDCVLAYEAGELAVPQGSRLPVTAPRVAFVDAVRSVRRQRAGLVAGGL